MTITFDPVKAANAGAANAAGFLNIPQITPPNLKAPIVPAPIKAPTPIVFSAPTPVPMPVVAKPAAIVAPKAGSILFNAPAAPAPIVAPTAGKIDFNPPALAPRVVQNQTFGDVANTLESLITAPIGATDTLGRTVGKAVGLTAPKLEIPNLAGGGNQYESTTLQDSYKARIANGDSKAKALAGTAVEGGLDILTAIPLFEGVRTGVKYGLKAKAPGTLINAETLSASKEAVHDFLSGRVPENESPLPLELKKAIKEAPDKKPYLKGIDLSTAIPSRLGSFLGVSQEEADQILAEMNRKPITAADQRLPGYVPDNPGAIPVGLSTERVNPVGFAEKAPVFEGFKDLSTNTLDQLKGKAEVSKQFISDLTNRPELKQAERDIVRQVLADYPDGKPVPVNEFAQKVHAELLPLNRKPIINSKYESISLPDELRGPVANYKEHIYESPIKTSAGDVHFPTYGETSRRAGTDSSSGYFGHTRVEDMGRPAPFSDFKDNQSGTRRVIEVQSDLYQKGRLESEAPPSDVFNNGLTVNYDGKLYKVMGTANGRTFATLKSGEDVLHNIHIDDPKLDLAPSNKVIESRKTELSKLKQYSNPTAHFRMVREEVKQAAKDGKTKLQFPTGETAMKIEGLGSTDRWYHLDPGGYAGSELARSQLEVGKSIVSSDSKKWVITDVLGDGKFKAVPKDALPRRFEYMKNGKTRYETRGGMVELHDGKYTLEDWIKDHQGNYAETFDISGKVDTSNPIYKFYEKELGRYLKNTYGATPITDKQGVSWYEVPVKLEYATKPVQAFKKGGQFTPNMTAEEAQTIIDKLFKGDEVHLLFSDDLGPDTLGRFDSAGRGRFGQKLKPMITLLEQGGKIDDTVLYHEAFHAHFNTFLTEAERAAAISKVKKNFLAAPHRLNLSYAADQRAEEWLADDFADYVKSKAAGEKPTSSFSNLWEKLLGKIRSFIRRVEGFTKMYDDLINGERTANAGEKSISRMKIGNTSAELLAQLPDEESLAKLRARREEVRQQIMSKYDAGEKAGEILIKKYNDLDARILAHPDLVDKTPAPLPKKVLEGPNYKEIEAGNKELNKIEDKQSFKNRQKQIPPPAVEQKVQNLQIEKADLEQVVNDHPAKDLSKYASQTTGRLPEITGKNTMKSLTGSGQVVKNSEYGRKGDDIAQELGFMDGAEAQTAFEDYTAKKERLATISEELTAARRASGAAKAEQKDEQAVARLADKTARATENEIAKRDTAIKKNKEVIAAENARQEALKLEAAKKATLGEKIAQARKRKVATTNYVKTIYRALKPLAALDTQTKGIITDWVEQKAMAKVDAETTVREMRSNGPQNMEEINAYEAGKQTPYIKRAFDDLGTRAKNAGMDFGYKADYMPHVYMQSPEEVVQAIARYLKSTGLSDLEIQAYMDGERMEPNKSLRLKLNPDFVRERTFPSYSVAAKYGLAPKYRTPAQLIGHYQSALDTAIANRDLIDTLKREAKILTAEDAPDNWTPISRTFSKSASGEALYAEPPLANLINGIFRDEANLSVWARTVKIGGGVARFVQHSVLGASGVPFTPIHLMSFAKTNLSLNAAIGEGLRGNFPAMMSSLRQSFALIRAISNSASIKFFDDNISYIARMAEDGFDLSGRVGTYEQTAQSFREMLPNFDRSASRLTNAKIAAKSTARIVGVAFDKVFTEKTFHSLMQQRALIIYRDTYNAMRDAGYEDKEAGKLAAKTLSAFEGLEPDLKGKTTKDTMRSGFIAPEYRLGIMSIISNTADAVNPFGKGWNDPGLAKNRNFFLGTVVSFLLYQLMNHKLNGHFTWNNPPGREMALRIPKADGGAVYVEFMPSTLSLPRNLLSGANALVHGDFALATQKVFSAASIPIQLFSEAATNKDYFGRAIYKPTDDTLVKDRKIIAHLGLGASPGWITEGVKYANGDESLWAAFNYAIGGLLKNTTQKTEQNAVYYAKTAAEAKARSDAAKAMQPIYDSNQKLKAEGKAAEADKVYWGLTDDQRAVYNKLKSAEATKATNAKKPAISAIYDSNQALILAGHQDEADKIYWNLSPADRKIYNSVKNAAKALN